jgi:hypothetical protein
MGNDARTADLGSLQPEIDLAAWMNTDPIAGMPGDLDPDDLPVTAGGPHSVWVYTPHRVDV